MPRAKKESTENIQEIWNEILFDKIKEIEDSISSIQLFIKQENKRRRISFYTSLIFFILLSFSVILSYFSIKTSMEIMTSQEFLSTLQAKAVEVTPYISKRFGETMKEYAPVVYDQLRTKVEESLPQISQKISDEYVPQFLENIKAKSKDTLSWTLSEIKITLEEFVDTETDVITKQLQEKMKDYGLDDPQKFEELKALIVDELHSSITIVMQDTLANSLNQCVLQWEKIFAWIEDFKNKPDSERTLYIFNVLRWFVDWLDYMQNGRLPDSYKIDTNVSTNTWEALTDVNTTELYDIMRLQDWLNLYSDYMRKTKNGKYKIKDLTKENWWTKYDLKTRQAVWFRIEQENQLYDEYSKKLKWWYSMTNLTQESWWTKYDTLIRQAVWSKIEKSTKK